MHLIANGDTKFLIVFWLRMHDVCMSEKICHVARHNPEIARWISYFWVAERASGL